MSKKTCFNCLGAACPNHCCGAYNAVSPSLRTLGEVQPTEIVLLPKDVEQLEAAGLHDLIRRGNDGHWRIITESDGRCAALKNGECSIYESRPSICKAYPLYMDMYTGACVLKECPGAAENMRLEDFQEAMNSLLDVYQYWIDHYRKDTSDTK